MINFNDCAYDRKNVFEFENKLYEDLRSVLHLDHNQDLVESNIKFRVIFSEYDYDYIENDEELTNRLEEYRDQQLSV